MVSGPKKRRACLRPAPKISSWLRTKMANDCSASVRSGSSRATSRLKVENRVGDAERCEMIEEKRIGKRTTTEGGFVYAFL